PQQAPVSRGFPPGSSSSGSSGSSGSRGNNRSSRGSGSRGGSECYGGGSPPPCRRGRRRERPWSLKDHPVPADCPRAPLGLGPLGSGARMALSANDQGQGLVLGRGVDPLDLRELQAVASALRRDHEPGCEAMAAVAAATRMSIEGRAGPGAALGMVGGLCPMPTTRLKPMSHQVDGGAASMAILEDGRASLRVGDRWITVTADG
ncbi:unnamed protein product, partial [Discosporangium mesarthrocarpum]